jgi:hypothetical protein
MDEKITGLLSRMFAFSRIEKGRRGWWWGGDVVY